MRQKSEERIIPAPEKQRELFAEFQTTKPKRAVYPFRRDMMFGKKVMFDLSYENIILLVISFIMLLVIFFALGVEKGKRITAAPVEEEKRVNVVPEIREPEEPKVAEGYKPAEKEMIEEILKPYTIQVVAFKKEESAKKEMERLKNNGYEAFIIPSEDWLQVCAGRYIHKEESEKDFTDLKKKYPTCYFRKIKE